MIKIIAETHAKNCIDNKDIGEKLGIENIYDLIDKEIC